MSTATEHRSPTTVSQPAGGATRRQRGWWLATGLVALLTTIVFTWPLALHPGSIWKASLRDPRWQQAPYLAQYAVNDGLQTMFIQTQVLNDLRHLREPFLDLDEGAAGPAPLRTTSLDTPWVVLTALAWPLFGLVAAYNLMLLLGAALSVVTATGLFRRHTRWPLLALAGGVAYAFVPYHVLQLGEHFNGVMWSAFPALAWSFEALLQRWREGGRWRVPAAWLVTVAGTVALSGEFHLTLYMIGLLGWLVLWSLAGAALARRRPPWWPLAIATGAAGLAGLYSLLSFRWAFRGGVAGGNGQYGQVVAYAPTSLGALVRKLPGLGSEGFIYVGWPVSILAAAGFALALWRSRARGYALLTPVLLLLTYGPTVGHLGDRVGLHGLDPYRFIFDTVPMLKLQRVSGRIMVLTAMLLVLLAVLALDAVGGWLSARRAWWPGAGAALLLLGTLWLASDYRVVGGSMLSSERDNQVVRLLARSGDRDGPFLGLPVLGQTHPENSRSTYLAAQSRRSVLNAYNQTTAPWLEARNRQLAPLNGGKVTAGALAALRATGTRQVVVIDERNFYEPGEPRTVAARLLASGHFSLVVEDGPFTLLRFTG
jgi:hypothetical protein